MSIAWVNFRGLYAEPVARQADHRLKKVRPETVLGKPSAGLWHRASSTSEKPCSIIPLLRPIVLLGALIHPRPSRSALPYPFLNRPLLWLPVRSPSRRLRLWSVATQPRRQTGAGLSLSQQVSKGGAADFPKLEVDRLQSRLNRMSSGVLTATRLIDSEVEATKIRFHRYMITLTYRPGVVWQPWHISKTIKFYRIWAEKNNFKLRYVWVSEIQEGRFQRGDSLLGECVHYHLLIWVPVRLSPPMADKQGWWSYGMTNRVRVSRPVKYMMKYASKGQSVEFPKGLRIHGCGGLVESARNERRWWLMPRWVRAIFSIDDLPFRCPGGGIVSRLTGEWLPSIWQIHFDHSRIFVSLRDDLLDFFSIGRVNQLIDQGVI